MIVYLAVGAFTMFSLFGAYAVCIYATDHTLEEMKREHNISEATYKLHRTLIRSLVVQVLVPFCSIALSLCGIFTSLALELSHTRGESYQIHCLQVQRQ